MFLNYCSLNLVDWWVGVLPSYIKLEAASTMTVEFVRLCSQHRIVQLMRYIGQHRLFDSAKVYLNQVFQLKTIRFWKQFNCLFRVILGHFQNMDACLFNISSGSYDYTQGYAANLIFIRPLVDWKHVLRSTRCVNYMECWWACKRQ